MDEMLDALLDGVTEPAAEADQQGRGEGLIVLLGALDDDAQPQEIRYPAGEMRFRLGSRLAVPL
ncbi:hypothetical protein [Streptomyces sp. NPDC056544]|uniref:hypothetical protein n=1 Tax=unclassified Streptomyces TaxID=2593676 RepID=UPI003695B6B9